MSNSVHDAMLMMTAEEKKQNDDDVDVVIELLVLDLLQIAIWSIV